MSICLYCAADAALELERKKYARFSQKPTQTA
jgi:hypothetical protein